MRLIIKKNKINLSDYNYQKDIKNRLLLAQLSPFDVEVLREILHSSLSIPIDHLAEALSVGVEDLASSIQKFNQAEFIDERGGILHINKALRKQYELQIARFDDDFQPNIDFFKGLLKHIPMHVLPVWYMIPRNADHIFSSIIEKYFLTPKVYRRYLLDLHFENPILKEIMTDVFAAPGFEASVSSVMTKQGISRTELEECMLYLEFSYVCCIRYRCDHDKCEAVITPFHEWYEYLCFQRDTAPKSISATETIVTDHSDPFAFLKEINASLERLQESPASVYALSDRLFFCLTALQLAHIQDSTLSALEGAKQWLAETLENQAAILYRTLVTQSAPLEVQNKRSVEKSLKKIIPYGWVYFDDFVQGITAPIGNAEPVTLQRIGKRWQYTLPSYGEKEHALIKQMILQDFSEAGIVATGTHDGKFCLGVTPFGRMFIE